MVKSRSMACVLVIVVAATSLVFAEIRTADVRRFPASDREIATLRGDGPEGLKLALEKYDELLQNRDQLAAIGDLGAAETEKMRQEIAQLEARLADMRAAIDQIGGQRTCTVSRLYWFTDLEKAKVESARTHKPILSLRMLGKLTDEFSCANSRFFRTALYSNKDVSELLRSNFVLHWQSVRPVPRVTIDFGDGRKLERTLTGNSAHYILASDGTPLDVLPGLYSPLVFQQWLARMREFHNGYQEATVQDRPTMLTAFHSTQRDNILKQWDRDIQFLGNQRADLVSTRITSAIETARLAGEEVPANELQPNAVKAARRVISKSIVEAPMLRFANLGGAWMERGMDDDLWQAVSNLHREEVKLDDASVAVVRQEFPAAVAMRVAVSKYRQEDPVLRMVRTFEDSMSLDTVRNEYLMHRRIHEMLADSKSGSMDFDALNEWVYTTLFLTPSSDPWLGLAPNDVYTALEQNGRTEAVRN